MRILLFHILFALLSQQTTFLETENLKTSKSELETENLKNSKSEKIQKNSQVFSFSDSQILYYENQIRLADSLYKNYLPQYNFDEVKAAVMFFDSLRLTTANGQQTTFLETENLKTSKSEKVQKDSQVFNFSDSQILFYALALTTTTPWVSLNATTLSEPANII